MTNEDRQAQVAGKEKKSIINKVMVGFYRGNAILLSMVSFTMFALMCVEVLIRYVFSSDMRAMEEYIYFFLMWLVMLGASNAVLEDSHLRSDTLKMLIHNKRLLNTLMLIVDFIELLLYGLFAYYAFLYLLDAIELPAFSRVWRLSKLIGQSAVFYGGVMMLIFGVYRFQKNVRFRISAMGAYRTGQLGAHDDAEILLNMEGKV